MTALPPALAHGIERLLEGVSRKDIAARAARLSDHYRSGGTSALVADRLDVAAYLLTRLPATYAATAAALAEISARAPDFAPKHCLDAGAGPGTASWAAAETWPALSEIRLLDKSTLFRDISRELAALSEHPALQRPAIIARDLSDSGALAEADLVIASYALAECPAERIAGIVSGLWAACGGILVLVEPGTPAGFARILAARSALLRQEARIVAPCPHAQACPIVAPGWCHFSQRLPRRRDHKLAKTASVPFEDEKFSYLAVARPHVAIQSYRARLVAPPHRSKAAIAMTLCEAGEIRKVSILARDREAYARHRRLDWGDAL